MRDLSDYESKDPNGTCPECGPVLSAVKDSRPVDVSGQRTIRRRRLCPKCDGRFTTYELSLDVAQSEIKGRLNRLIHRLIDEIMDEGGDQ